MNYHLSVEQSQQLSQNQIQSLEILAMDTVSLKEFIQNEYLENPLLEYTPVSQRSLSDSDNPEPFWFSAETGGDSDWQDKRERTDTSPMTGQDENSLKEYIQSQLPNDDIIRKHSEFINYLIDSLDGNGYFTGSIAEAARICQVELREAEYCLNQLRCMEPRGIFAANLKECLLNQLKAQEPPDDILLRLVQDHLEDIAAGRLSVITRSLGISTAAARQSIRLIRKLNPRPAAGFAAEETRYIVPDLTAVIIDGRWEITFNDEWVGDYKLSDYYLKLMAETTDPELKRYFRQKQERVKTLLNNIERRRETILRIVEAVLEWQSGYFTGQAPLKPMTMAQISEKTHMHTSTVSRGIHGKYLLSPRGTVLMKELFSRASASFGKGNEEDFPGLSPSQIKKRIRELIGLEEPSRPYSDQVLVEILEKENISVSRRTVAKYREEMHIASSRQRKL